MHAAWYSVSSHMTARHLYSSVSNVSNMSFQRIFMHTWNAVTVYFSLFLFLGERISSSLFPQSFAADPESSLFSSYWSEEKVCLHGNQVWFSSLLFIYLVAHPSVFAYLVPSLIFQSISVWVPEKEICYYRGSVVSYCLCLFGCMSSVATATTHFSPWSAHRNHIFAVTKSRTCAKKCSRRL